MKDRTNYFDEDEKIFWPVMKAKREVDVFKVYRASTNEVWQTDFLISCHPLLTEYYQTMQEVLQ